MCHHMISWFPHLFDQPGNLISYDMSYSVCAKIGITYWLILLEMFNRKYVKTNICTLECNACDRNVCSINLLAKLKIGDNVNDFKCATHTILL